MKKAVVVAALTVVLAGRAATGGEEKTISVKLPDFRHNTWREIDEPTNALAKAYYDITGRLNWQLKKAPPETLAHIMYLIGTYRSKVEVEWLVDMIDFRARACDPAWRWARWGFFPAQEALGKIGKPASRAVIKRLPKEDDELRRMLMCMVILHVEGEEVGSLILENEISKAEKKDEKERLRAAFKIVQGFRGVDFADLLRRRGFRAPEIIKRPGDKEAGILLLQKLLSQAKTKEEKERFRAMLKMAQDWRGVDLGEDSGEKDSGNATDDEGGPDR